MVETMDLRARYTWFLVGAVAVALLAVLPAGQGAPAGVQSVVLRPGPVSIEGTAPDCPVKALGDLSIYVGQDFVGKLFGDIVSVGATLPDVDFDLYLYRWNAGTLDCVRSPDGGVIITSSRDASILAGVGFGSGAV